MWPPLVGLMPTNAQKVSCYDFYYHGLVLPVLVLHINGILEYILFIWLFVIQHYVRIIRFVVCSRNSFFFTVE